MATTTTCSVNGADKSKWARFLALFLLFFFLAALFALRPAFAAAPPAGTSITNAATATYTDASGTTRTVTSNTVTTTVNQVYSFTLNQSNSQSATPGTNVYFPHTLKNTGNGTDTYTLSAANATGFTMSNVQIYLDNGSGQPTGSPITSTGALAAGASFNFIVVGTVPTTATSGQTNTITVTGGSAHSANQTSTDTTTVTTNAVISVIKSISATTGPADGTTKYTYTLTYTNTGNTTSGNVTLSDVVPSSMTYVANSSTWNGTAVGTDGTTGTPKTIGSAPNTMTQSANGNALQFVVNQVGSGQSGTVTFQVTVNTTAPAGTGIPNTATFMYQPTVGGTAGGSVSTNTVTFTPTATAGVTLTPPAAISSVPPGSLVTFNNTLTNTGSATDTFNITVGTSTFPAGTTFTLYKSDGVTPLTDTNGDGIPDTGPVAAGATYTVVLKAQLPANVSSSTAVTVNKTATSVNDPTKTATATDTLSGINANYAVDLTNNAALGSSGVLGAGPGPEANPVVTNTTSPGSTTSFQLYANNTGSVADTYTLTAGSTTSGTGGLPTGWSVAFYAGTCPASGTPSGTAITSTGSAVANGANAAVCAVVTVPSGAAAATSNVYFKVAGTSPSTASDVIHDAIVVKTRALTLTPNNTNQTYPGGTVVYSHTLTNTGAVAEGGTNSTITLTAGDTQTGWTSVLYYAPVGTAFSSATLLPSTGVLPVTLNPGQSYTVFDKVTAFSGAAAGTLDTSTVTAATTNGSNTGTAPANAVATNQTTVVTNNLQLVKTQAIQTGCTGTIGTYTTAAQNANPGDCVYYQVKASNVGSAPASNVQINDATPSYTTMNTVATATTTIAGTTSNVASVTSPAVGGTGTISAPTSPSSITLNPGDSETLSFSVKIQN